MTAPTIIEPRKASPATQFVADAGEKIVLAFIVAAAGVLSPPINGTALHAAEAAGIAAAVRAAVAIVQAAVGRRGAATFLPDSLNPSAGGTVTVTPDAVVASPGIGVTGTPTALTGTTGSYGGSATVRLEPATSAGGGVTEVVDGERVEPRIHAPEPFPVAPLEAARPVIARRRDSHGRFTKQPPPRPKRR